MGKHEIECADMDRDLLVVWVCVADIYIQSGPLAWSATELPLCPNFFQ